MTALDAKKYLDKFKGYGVYTSLAQHSRSSFGLRVHWDNRVTRVSNTAQAHELLMKVKTGAPRVEAQG